MKIQKNLKYRWQKTNEDKREKGTTINQNPWDATKMEGEGRKRVSGTIINENHN